MKVGIIGCGLVGSTAAYAMIHQGTCSEAVLVDINQKAAQAQAEDLLHATPFAHTTKISAGSYADLTNAGVVILSCGVSQRPGESRLQLLQRNIAVFKQVIPQVLGSAPGAILVVASNPVDILTYAVTHIGDLPPQQVIGSGTILDTARFRSLLGEYLGVSPHSVHAYVLGEHGDSEVLVWSSADISGVPIFEFARQRERPIDEAIIRQVDEGVRRAAYRIIEGKGATYYGIGSGLSKIVDAIRDNEQTVLTVSSCLPAGDNLQNVSLSLPRVVGSGGIHATLQPYLSSEERSRLAESASILRGALDEIGL